MGLVQQIVIVVLLIGFSGIEAHKPHNETIVKNLIDALSQFVQGKNLVVLHTIVFSTPTSTNCK